MFTIMMYIVASCLLILSFIKDRKKTLLAMKKAWKSFENILPQFLAIIVIIGIMLAILSPEVISGLIGEKLGWLGMLIAYVTEKLLNEKEKQYIYDQAGNGVA
ncbi:hypothetical protein [Desulfosporosinus lacus]|uniref:Uncharacterized protein n=1 Tax=Desulfosporosinus lacus DSM 15449 TaxID=1121420 RepID=A0A1M5Z647_9FIRM|nr:hypothetical protein SAMN02746098_02988 [Desulfosporosinus lacus DSM 15449]